MRLEKETWNIFSLTQSAALSMTSFPRHWPPVQLFHFGIAQTENTCTGAFRRADFSQIAVCQMDSTFGASIQCSTGALFSVVRMIFADDTVPVGSVEIAGGCAHRPNQYFGQGESSGGGRDGDLLRQAAAETIGSADERWADIQW
jgi:hypothetical protein